MDKLLHRELLADYRMKMLMEDIAKRKPLMPNYDPKSNNIEELKYASAQQQVFETLMVIINPFDKPL